VKTGGGKLNVLLLDGDQELARRIALCLDRGGRAQVFVLSSQNRSLSEASIRIHKVLHCLAAGDQACIEFLRQAVPRYKIGLVMGCSTIGISFLIRNSQILSGIVPVAAIPTAEQFAIAEDKWLTAVELERLHIPTPRTMLFGPAARVLGFPTLIKPRAGFGGRGILRIGSEKEFADLLSSLGDRAETYVAQQFIEGSDIDCSVLCRDGKILASTVQWGISGGDDFGPSTELILDPDPEPLAITAKMMAGLKWNGIAHVDLRRAKDGRLHVLEINPRYWWTLPGSLFAGVNFPHLAMLDALGESFPVPVYTRTAYLKLGSLLRGGSSARATPILSTIGVRLADPLPMLVARTLDRLHINI